MSKGHHFRGPKKFTPLEAYQPGSMTPPAAIATPQRSDTMGLATIIEDFSVPAKPMTQTPPPHKAGVLHLAQDGTPLNPRTMPAPAQPEPEKAVDDTIVKSSRATRVFDSVQPVDTEKEAGAEAVTEPLSEVEQVRLNAQRKITEQGQKISALEQQMNDILAATTKKQAEPVTHPALAAPNMAELQKEIDAVSKNFLDDPEGSAKKIMELSVKAAQASIVPILQQSEQRSQVEATKALVKQYPGLITNKAEAAYVDTAADLLAQEDGASSPTMEHLQQALDAYAKKVGWTKQGTTAKVNEEVEGMKRAATSAPVSASTPGTSKGKIWRKSELDALLTKYPDKYRDLQPEIMRAYRENRVK